MFVLHWYISFLTHVCSLSKHAWKTGACQTDPLNIKSYFCVFCVLKKNLKNIFRKKERYTLGQSSAPTFQRSRELCHNLEVDVNKALKIYLQYSMDSCLINSKYVYIVFHFHEFSIRLNCLKSLFIENSRIFDTLFKHRFLIHGTNHSGQLDWARKNNLESVIVLFKVGSFSR